MQILKNPWFWLALLGLACIALIYWLHVRFPDALSSRDGQIDLAHTLLILVFVCSSIVLNRRFQARKVIRYAGLWLAIGGLVFISYSLRYEFTSLGNRLLGELIPSMGLQQGEAMRFPVSSGGHFVVEAVITTDAAQNPVRMLVDTGASDVVLSPADARRLGFDPDTLDFSKVYRTANGTVYGAPVRLRSLTIGSIRIDNVRASVNGAEMSRSLLGMSFLERLSGYEVTAGSLILYP
ncbi:MAG: TIGR02281 family clan AA aspartic protease [Rhodospirillales bacterium]|nr:TIGR02281 family clan AA aspartic protease [Rhodospirillales bacterium]